jgi:hypothetical protein
MLVFIHTMQVLMWVLQKPHHPPLEMFLVLPMKIIVEPICKYCVRLQMAIAIPICNTHLACAQREFPNLI